MCSAFFVWHLLLLYTVLQVCVCASYNVSTEQTVASAALATVDAYVHALTAVVLQAVRDEPLEQLHCTCQLYVIHIYVSLGNGDAAVSSKFS